MNTIPFPSFPGRAKRGGVAVWLLMSVGAVALLAFLAASLRRAPSSSGKKEALTVFCAAGLKPAIEQIALDYERLHGTRVHLQYGGSGLLLNSLKAAGTNSAAGDLYIPADESYAGLAARDGLVREVLALARQKPVLAVAAGNPKGIKGLDDLLREDVRVGLANPEAASVGALSQRLLEGAGLWDRLAGRAAVMKPTVNDLASDLKLGTVDTAILWDSTVASFGGMEAVPVELFAKHPMTVSACVLAGCAQPSRALHFARYMAAPETGGPFWRQKGFEAGAGDKWADSPKLVLFSGAVNRRGIEGALKDFCAREGVEISTTYNGCGILCASMQTMLKADNAQLPDAYYACDICFVPPVAELFPEAVLLTETRIVIAVAKGNPKAVQSLADLARPGLRVGIGHMQQSTLGFMTSRLLEVTNLDKAVRKNVVSEQPTADILATQLITGSLDAAILYTVNVQQQSDKVDTIPIDHAGARAVQPFAVSSKTPFPAVARRLLKFLEARRADFERAGFTWVHDGAPLQSAGLRSDIEGAR